MREELEGIVVLASYISVFSCVVGTVLITVLR